MKVGITGSNNYQNKRKIKDFLFNIKNEYDNNILIATRANDLGADRIIKQICKWELGIDYTEFPPLFKPWNPDCEKNGQNKYKYNKNYSARYYIIRDLQFIDFCNSFVIFVEKNTEDNNIKKFIKRLNKEKSNQFLLTN